MGRDLTGSEVGRRIDHSLSKTVEGVDHGTVDLGIEVERMTVVGSLAFDVDSSRIASTRCPGCQLVKCEHFDTYRGVSVTAMTDHIRLIIVLVTTGLRGQTLDEPPTFRCSPFSAL
jgi:hypothetical protein